MLVNLYVLHKIVIGGGVTFFVVTWEIDLKNVLVVRIKIRIERNCELNGPKRELNVMIEIIS